MSNKLIDTMAQQAITTTEGFLLLAAPAFLIFCLIVGMAYAHAAQVTGRDPVADLFATLKKWGK